MLKQNLSATDAEKRAQTLAEGSACFDKALDAMWRAVANSWWKAAAGQLDKWSSDKDLVQMVTKDGVANFAMKPLSPDMCDLVRDEDIIQRVNCLAEQRAQSLAHLSVGMNALGQPTVDLDAAKLVHFASVLEGIHRRALDKAAAADTPNWFTTPDVVQDEVRGQCANTALVLLKRVADQVFEQLSEFTKKDGLRRVE